MEEKGGSNLEKKSSIRLPFMPLLVRGMEVIGKSTRWTVAGLVAVALIVRRDAAVINFTTGAILNAFLGKILKRVIKEARPDGARLEDPGMPSSHAMALFFMSAFLASRLHLDGLPSFWPLAYWPTVATIGAYVVTASVWRIHSGLHTIPQIGVGAAVGASVGWAWQHYCHNHLDAWLTHLLPYPTIPLVYVAGLMIVGALTVGSVERKIGRFLHAATRKDQ